LLAKEKPVAMPNEKKTTAEPGTARQWGTSDRLQALSVAVSVAALGVALFAAVTANNATSKANQLAANSASGSLRLASPVTARTVHGKSMYEVSLNLTNQGGGDARFIEAYMGTLLDIQNVNFVGTCPQPTRSYPFSFPLGKTLGVNNQLAGTAMVPVAVVPFGGTPANSMVLYVSWQDNDGSTETNCENLSNTSTVGNLVTFPQRLLSHPIL
jgi:hypothetical protein